MALAVDSVISDGGPAGSEAASGSFSFTNTAGTLLVVAISGFRNRTVSSITYNGVALTTAGARAVHGSGYYTDVFYLLSPATGAHTLAWTLSSTDGPTIACVSFTGNHASSPIGNVATDFSSGTTPSKAVTTANANSIVFSSVYTNSATLASATGSNQTLRWALVDNRYGSEGSGGSTQTTTTAGSYTSSYSTASAAWALSLVEIVAAVNIVTLDLTETLTLTDSQTGIRGVIVTLLESLSLTDSVSRSTSRSLSESISLTDSLSRTPKKVLTETITFLDTIGRGFTKVILESLTFIEDILLGYWQRRTKPTSAWTDRTEPSDTWTDRTKPPTTWS